ncbi:hypothetical protein DFP91_4726 [Pseudorhodoplanes sinuspersici]|uniref:Uncharacterized protein n=1 Tax=Pseudorhodoplanes sinuspersici TaxID=1235591 RepID=A0A1W6ZLB2_9HYPH|nr:hypothetical protein CAK95_01575 [Pseudorhodoplanes sinuspersici]RKE68349.1 hypothetical protein DFP91_4726 [Pseudorhodoplanes sinuspersici]
MAVSDGREIGVVPLSEAPLRAIYFLGSGGDTIVSEEPLFARKTGELRENSGMTLVEFTAFLRDDPKGA